MSASADGLFDKPFDSRYLKWLMEQPTTMNLWGEDRIVTPKVLPGHFGDGRRMIRLCPTATRCEHYIVQIDSSWRLSNTGTGPSLRGHIHAIYQAIGDYFGEWDEDGNDDDGEEYPGWPVLNTSLGCEWHPVYPADLPHPPDPDWASVKALTLWAPWAWAVMHLGKRIENRADKGMWRGGGAKRLVGSWLLIHAGAASRWNRSCWNDVRDVMKECPGAFEIARSHGPSILREYEEDTSNGIFNLFQDSDVFAKAFSELPRMMPRLQRTRDSFCSHIVGMVPVIGLRQPIHHVRDKLNTDGWWFTDQWGIELGTPIVFKEPIPAKGTITPLLWPVQGEVLEQVKRQYQLSRPSVVSV